MMASKSVGVIPLALSLVTSFMSGLFKLRAAFSLVDVQNYSIDQNYFSNYGTWCSRRDFEMWCNVRLVFNHILFRLRLDCFLICSSLL